MIVLAALGARTPRNAGALALAVPRRLPADRRALAVEPLGARARLRQRALFALYIVLADRVAKHDGLRGIDGLARGDARRAVVVTPIGGWAGAARVRDPVVLLAGIGVGICSSVIPYVADQLALARLARATYALMVSLLPATATVIGIVVLAQSRARPSSPASRWSSPASRSTASPGASRSGRLRRGSPLRCRLP